MDLLATLFLMGIGIYLLLKGLFPELRDKDFQRWSVEEGGISVEFLGFFEKVIRPSKVIAEGKMSEKTAVRVYSSIGFLMIAVGFLAFRHITGIPAWFPDVVGQLFR